MERFYFGNQIELLKNGDGYFPALLREITTARYSIHIETYIFELDDSGVPVAEALIAAAARGVQVHLLLDGFGARDFPTSWQARMLKAGIRLLFFRPEISRWALQRRRLRRLHRKIAVIDARVAFVGGINIIDDRNTPHQVPPRYDYAVRVQGPLLPAIQDAVRHMWWQVCWAQFKQPWLTVLSYPAESQVMGDMEAALVVRDNLRHRRAIEQCYLAAIQRAHHEILIANAYFLPGIAFRRALFAAAKRGVRVVVLLQGRVEYLLLHYATRTLYRSFLDNGIEIWEYRRSFMHAKVAVIDGVWATVGSSNIDPFSLLLAREANVVVRDSRFAAELRHDLFHSLAYASARVELDEVRRAPWWRRILPWLSYALVRSAMGIVGYGRQEYTASDE
ncbi:cardiolipin synthase [Chitinivorax tropicus]|uniref:Cardiolipin synthase B n=1 Tax=Chitinivorax tropicus TaxID=714531 RepID=A0A840MIQ8_9PROT|nr:cardiolipin synthase ClsB [Chitinivorax tropicus]MBB5019094.1 cardiolipin synthase [Chitinivorax tropicus]